MRQNKRNRQTLRTGGPKKGFTLLETLISLLLVSLAMLLGSKTVACAIDSYKKSRVRFKMTQQMEISKNQLLSKPFASIELQEGSYAGEEKILGVKWTIKNLTPTLKMICLSVAYKYKGQYLTKRATVYRSKYIKNNDNDNTLTGITEEKND